MRRDVRISYIVSHYSEKNIPRLRMVMNYPTD